MKLLHKNTPCLGQNYIAERERVHQEARSRYSQEVDELKRATDLSTEDSNSRVARQSGIYE